jgi:hypothetical protein
VSERDDFAEELRGDEDDVRIVKGHDWVASIVSGIIVGGIVAGASLWASRAGDKNDTLVEVKTRVEYLTTAVNKLTEQPYVRRDEYQADRATIENRVSGLERRLDQREQRDDSSGRKR